ncbi:MAG TPA: restriction endonuclease subunit S [Solirubrobacteraceae bacterium]|nr:restriction endonuclease subunit S [Solirubrobacteraceae bacterium]
MSLNLDKSTWKRVAFGEVVRNVNQNVRDPEPKGIDRVIAMEHLDPGELKIGRWGSLSDGTTFTRRVTPGQTLFGKRRAYQRKVAYAEFDAICSGDILTFEADETQILPEFLPFLAQSDKFFDHALGTSAGSLSPRTNWRDLSNFEFDLPPVDEQKRIADLVWSVEHHRRSLSALRASLAAGTDQHLSSQLSPGDNDISAYANILVGFAFVSSSFLRQPSSSSRRLLRGINIGVGVTRWATSDTVHWADTLTERTAKYVLRAGDVVVPMDRPFTADGRLRWAELTDAENGTLLVQRVARLRPRDRAYAPLVRAIVRSTPFQSALNGSLTGSFAPHLAHGDFVRYRFAVPSLSKATAAVHAAEAAEASLEQKRINVDRLYYSLLIEIFGDN